MMKKTFASPSHSFMVVVWTTTVGSSQSRESEKYFQLKFNLWYGKHSASHVPIFHGFRFSALTSCNTYSSYLNEMNSFVNVIMPGFYQINVGILCLRDINLHRNLHTSGKF